MSFGLPHPPHAGDARRQGEPRPRRAGPYRERGQSLAELAVVLPILLILTLGAIDLGRLYHTHVSVTNAARTAAQFASASPSNAADTAGIESAALQETDDLNPSPSISSTTGVDSRGMEYTRVTVTYTFSPLFHWPGLPDSVALSRSVQMRINP